MPSPNEATQGLAQGPWRARRSKPRRLGASWRGAAFSALGPIHELGIKVFRWVNVVVQSTLTFVWAVVGYCFKDFGSWLHRCPEPKHQANSVAMAISLPVRQLPNDHRGWAVLEVAAKLPTSSSRGIYDITVAGKHLQLVAQEQTMRVYVNPDKDGPDEWDIGGMRMLVFSPGNAPHLRRGGRVGESGAESTDPTAETVETTETGE